MKMPKFNKDQWQKIILSLIMFAILIYGYFQFLLGPLSMRMADDIKKTEELHAKVDDAQKQVKLGKNASSRSESAVITMQSIESMIPNESVIAWFPPVINKFFATRGLDKITLKMKGPQPVPGPGLERFKYYSWDLSLPPAPSIKAIAALSELENEKPLIAIRSLRIDANPDDPENQRVACEIRALLK